MHTLSRRARLRALVLTTSVAVLALVGSASAADPVNIELTKGKLKFSGPETVVKGEKLEVVNKTNPKQVGPHTFSLVAKSAVPKTRKAMNGCFAPKKICLAIALWHGFNPKTERITKNVVRVGPAGWSTEGSTIKKKGDSWFTEKKGAAISQVVSAQAGTTLHYICAVHPEMQGEVEVVAPPVPTTPTS